MGNSYSNKRDDTFVQRLILSNDEQTFQRAFKLTEHLNMYKLMFIQFVRSEVMAEAILDIKQWGNNLGVRLPAAVAREAHLHADQRVRISVEGDQVIISPIGDTQLTLEQRLAVYDAERHGGEQMTATRTLGAEHW
jgi:antitoxin MazE